MICQGELVLYSVKAEQSERRKEQRFSISWAPGKWAFNLAKIGVRCKLEERTGCGSHELLVRLVTGRWTSTELREILLWGLMGGENEGLKTVQEVETFLKKYHDNEPPFQFVPLATEIMNSALFGVEGDQPGKSDADRTETESASFTTTVDSSDPQSMDSQQPLDSRPDKPMTSPSGNSSPASRDTAERTVQMTSLPS